MQFLITSASDRLQQISATDDVDSVRVQVFRIQQSLREAREITAGLDSRLQPLLIGKLEEFRALVEGNNSIPELRLQELGIVAQATRNLTENTALSRDLTQAVDRLVSIAKRDIAQANEEALGGSTVQLDRPDRGRRAQPAQLHRDRLAICGAQHRLAIDRAQPQHAGNCRGQSCDKRTDRR